jgi:hypothetical protein
MVELVEVESYALALARQLMAPASAAFVFPDALCLARLATLRAGYGAHTGLPSADQLTFPSTVAHGDGSRSGSYVTYRPGEGPTDLVAGRAPA